MTPVDPDADNREFVDAVMCPLDSNPSCRELLDEALRIAATVPRQNPEEGIGTAAKRMLSLAKGFRFRVATHRIVLLLVFGAVAWSSVFGLPALRSLNEVLLANRVADAVSTTCCSHEGVPSFPRFGQEVKDLEKLREVQGILEAMSPDKRLLFLGDTSKKDPVERWKAVYDRYPRDPAHYFAYALSYRKANSRWPGDFVETGESLDPDNGWFRLVMGVEKVTAAVGMRPPPRISEEERLAARTEGRTAVRLDPHPRGKLEILDPKLIQQGYRLIDEALQKPRLDDYRSVLNRIRFESTPTPSDFARHSLGQILVFNQPEDGLADWYQLRDLNKSLALAAKDAARQGDADALQLLQDRVSSMGNRLAGIESVLLPKLIVRYYVKAGCQDLAEAWAALSDPTEAGRLIAIASSVDHKPWTSHPGPADALAENRGSGFLALAGGFSRGPAARLVSEPELRGGRLAEYAMYERFMAHGAAFILFIALAFALVRAAFERKRLGLLPERFAGLLTHSDRIRVLLLGVVLPFALYLASTRVAWMDSREFALGGTRFYLWLAQSLALALAVILISLDTASRCLNRRAPMLALKWRRRDHAWIFGWAALLSLPLASIMSRFDPGNDLQELMFWASVTSMVGIPLLYLCTLAAFVFGGSQARGLQRAILLRTLAMPLGLAASLAAASIPLLRQEERFWIARLDFDALHPGYNIFSPKPEREYAAWLGKDVQRAADEMAK